MKTRLIISLLLAVLITVGMAAALYLYPVNWSFSAWILALLAAFALTFFIAFYGKQVVLSIYRSLRTWWNKPNFRSDLLVLRRTVRRLFRRRSLYDVPIYVLFTRDLEKEKGLLGKLGFSHLDRFSKDSPVNYWIGHESTIITLDWGSQKSYPKLARDLGRSLRRIRPRQPLNGVLLNLDCDLLVDDSDSRAHEFAELSREQLRELARGTRIAPPIYTLVSGMSSLADFSQFFSTASEEICDSPLGATVQASATGHFDPGEFDAAYAQVLDRFAFIRNSSLLSQLDPDYRVSIAAAPLQMLMLKPMLAKFLAELARVNERERPVWIRAINFIDASAGREPKDLLSGAAAGAVGLRFTREARQLPSTRTLFARNLFSHGIRGDSQAIGVRRGADVITKVAMVGTASAWFGVMGFMAWSASEEGAFKANEFQTAINGAATYREAIKSASPQDFASSPQKVIQVLSELRDTTYAQYRKSRPATSFWIPKDEVFDAVRTMYQRELGRFGLPMLADKQYQILRDYQKSPSVRGVARAFRAAAIYVDLALSETPFGFNTLDNSSTEVVQFFLAQFQDLTDTQKLNLSQLVTDIDQMSYGNSDTAKQVQRFAAKQLDTFGVEQVCYQLIRTSARNGQRVELGSALRADFSDVYKLTPEQGLFEFKKTDQTLLQVPYLFTRDGFEALDLSAFSHDLRYALEYVSVINPRVRDALSVQAEENLASGIRELYIRDYIDVWTGILSSVEVKEAKNSSELQSLLAAASSSTTSPLAQLMGITNTHTKLYTPAPQEKKKGSSSKSTGVKAPASLSKLLKLEKKAQKSEQARKAREQLQKNLMAESITSAFVNFHKLLDPAAKQTQVAALMVNLHALNQWIQPFVSSADSGRDIFESWKAPDASGTNPIARMRLSADNYPEVIKAWLVDLSTNANSLLIGVAHEWLSRQWRNQVVSGFNQSLATRFPFQPASSADADLDEFSSFFRTRGIVDSFVSDWISPFRFGEAGSGKPPSFLWDDGLKLDPALGDFLKASLIIREALFDPGGTNLGLEFEMRVNEMPVDLTEFSVSSVRPLVVYRHGPAFWKSQVWPSSADKLDLRAFKGLALSSEQEIPGAWAWFRILAHSSPIMEGREIPVRIDMEDGLIDATVRLKGPHSPFDLSLYSSFKPPGSI